MANSYTGQGNLPTNTRTTTIARIPPSDDGSIMNRRRERRGLSSGFSSNLGRRRAVPTRQEEHSTRSSLGSSLIERLDSHHTEETCPTGSTVSETSPSVKSSKAMSSNTAVSSSSRLYSPGLDAPRDSLAFLAYSQYFTQSPLCRCLDDAPGGVGKEEECLEEVAPAAQSIRDAVKGRRFWNHVRKYLWINDDEVEDDRRPGFPALPPYSSDDSGFQPCDGEAEEKFRSFRIYHDVERPNSVRNSACGHSSKSTDTLVNQDAREPTLEQKNERVNEKKEKAETPNTFLGPEYSRTQSTVESVCEGGQRPYPRVESGSLSLPTPRIPTIIMEPPLRWDGDADWDFF